MRTLTYLVTGGAGFIGSAVVRELIGRRAGLVVNLDKLTYAGNLDSLASVQDHPQYRFVHADICDAVAVRRAFEGYQPTYVLHLAAESHVDRSIDAPADFVYTNVVGTSVLLSEATRYWKALDTVQAARFRFLHVSTDEVFGSLGPEGHFTESSPYDPSSPYAASKAAADHLVRAWHRTYADGRSNRRRSNLAPMPVHVWSIIAASVESFCSAENKGSTNSRLRTVTESSTIA